MVLIENHPLCLFIFSQVSTDTYTNEVNILSGNFVFFLLDLLSSLAAILRLPLSILFCTMPISLEKVFAIFFATAFVGWDGTNSGASGLSRETFAMLDI